MKFTYIMLIIVIANSGGLRDQTNTFSAKGGSFMANSRPLVFGEQHVLEDNLVLRIVSWSFFLMDLYSLESFKFFLHGERPASWTGLLQVTLLDCCSIESG